MTGSIARAATLTRSLSEAVVHAAPEGAQERALLDRAVADTLAVAAAGWAEPVVKKTVAVYAGESIPLWSKLRCESREAAVLIHATASHALDFDDVFLDSQVHASAVIVPVALVLARDEHTLHAGLSAGLITARAIAAELGAEHYHRGWHGTATIGAFSAAATAGRILNLSHEALASAFSLAAAMAGGLQANFGSMAKPLQAGFAASAGWRAAKLAAAGVSGSEDVFGRGFLRLYGQHEASSPGDYRAHPERLSVKLFPSCFAAARLIGIALDARRALGAIFDDDAVALRLTVPSGSLAVLRYPEPATGAEAKFSAGYNVAITLRDGLPTIDHFTDGFVSAFDCERWRRRLEIIEDEGQQSNGDITLGEITLDIRLSDGTVRSFTRRHIPGSPEDPADVDLLAAKWRACLVRARDTGTSFALKEILATAPTARRLLEEATDHNSAD